MAKKQYSVSVDFSAGVNSPQLHEELEADGTVAPIFEGVYKTGDTCENRRDCPVSLKIGRAHV